MPDFDLPGIDMLSDAYSPEIVELGRADPFGVGEDSVGPQSLVTIFFMKPNFAF